MFGSFGWMELLLILFIVLIVFGAGKLPQLGEGVGKAIKGFKRSVNEEEPPAEDVSAQGDAPAPSLPQANRSSNTQVPVDPADAAESRAGSQDSTSR